MSEPEQILALLASRNIQATIQGEQRGPRVTRYRLAVEDKVPLGRLMRLSGDLSAVLGRPVAVCGPLLGERGVAVDVSRETAEPVPWQPIYSCLAPVGMFCLGVGVLGEPVFACLADLPHLLVSGATGSGKSVALTSILLNLLQSGPESLRLVLIDLKRTELAHFAKLPHVLVPIATSRWAAMDCMRLVLALIEDRFRQMEAGGQRLWGGGKVVLVIDELAELILQDERAAALLCQIASLGRAAGVHVLAATQRPDSKVISGLLKANVPARLCFKLASAVDSRVALDAKGAELLLGAGDALFRQPGGNLLRLQAPLYSQRDVDDLLARWIDTPAPAFVDPRPKPIAAPVLRPAEPMQAEEVWRRVNADIAALQVASVPRYRHPSCWLVLGYGLAVLIVLIILFCGAMR